MSYLLTNRFEFVIQITRFTYNYINEFTLWVKCIQRLRGAAGLRPITR